MAYRADGRMPTEVADITEQEEMVRLRRVLKGIPMPIDIVVYSTSEVDNRRNLRGTMLYHALREGQVLYIARMGAKSTGGMRRT